MVRIFDSTYTTRELHPSLKVTPVLSYIGIDSLPSAIKTEDKLERYELHTSPLEDNLFKLTLVKEMRQGGRISGTVLIDIRDEMWVFLTTGSMYFVKHGIEHLLNTLYPRLSRIYINHYEMTHLLKAVKHGYGGSHVLTEFSAHIEEKSGKSTARKSVRIAGDTAERDLHRYSRNTRIWLDKVGFKIIGRDGGSLLESVIYSNGISRLVFGRFTDFYRNVVGNVIEKSEEIDGQYGSVRRDAGTETPILTPCTLTYQTQFDQSHVRSLLKGLSKQYTISVTNGGNPYLAAEVLDTDEGSSFGLTLSERFVTIAPMLRSTKPALWRITTDIQSILGEGAVSVPS